MSSDLENKTSSLGEKEREKLGGDIHAMIRVNHAGESGAVQIYRGQIAVLKRSSLQKTLQHMLEQEEQHLKLFNDLMIEHRVRPTLFSPLWHGAAFAMGVVTAMLGKKAALVCTVAVEEVIESHYEEQKQNLETSSHPHLLPLKKAIETCQADEVQHRETALHLGAKESLGYPLLHGAIQIASKAAILLSKRF